MIGYLLVTVQGQIYHGERTCSTIISKHYIEMRERLNNWYNGFPGICDSFHYYIFKWIESVNVFFIEPLYEWNMWMFSLMFVNWVQYMNVFFTVCLYEWNMWIFSLLFINMNGIYKCIFFYIICWYGWTPWFVFHFYFYMNRICDFFNGIRECALSSIYINGICECVLYRLLRWMESVNVFFIVC